MLDQDDSIASKVDRFSFYKALAEVDFEAVQEDLRTLFVDSQESWPADYGNYGPFFIRLAWHCNGSYRTSDGRGGCDGGRQRFDPEQSWDDNTNLDKARGLLQPIKEKYGLGLSWGDLFSLAGTTAIESMGGPVLGFCAGRVDDHDGTASLELGPTPEQEALYPCEPEQGDCQTPLGATTIGLIYVNPEGPMGVPDPLGSASDVRDTFARMNMNDEETVALIGGGHSFGKAHGACPAGPGPPPSEDPSNPWPGECGTGKGVDAFTSGFEGPWTVNPTSWDNSYFQNLVDYEWESWVGPGGHYQWRVSNSDDDDVPTAPAADFNGTQNVMMMTSDISLITDPAYKAIVENFAANQSAFDDAFKNAWYKLVTRDMGPYTRCVSTNGGFDLPPPQPWQYPLPAAPPELPDFSEVAAAVKDTLSMPQDDVLEPDVYDGKPWYGALMVRLAWSCASTFRSTDYMGGCNGARIRFPPQSEWPTNVALDSALSLLSPIKDSFGDALTWADLIVVAGTVALAEASESPLLFCGGRSDALEADDDDEDDDEGVSSGGSQYLAPTVTGSTEDTIDELKDLIARMGLSLREFVALVGGGHSLGQMHQDRSGYQGAWTLNPTTLDNAYFTALLGGGWEAFSSSNTGDQFRKALDDGDDDSSFVYALQTDLLVAWDPEMAAIAAEYASVADAAAAAAVVNKNNSDSGGNKNATRSRSRGANEGTMLLRRDFAAAWTKLMLQDRFDRNAIGNCVVLEA